MLIRLIGIYCLFEEEESEDISW